MATLTYVYAESTAVLGPLATYAEPHCYDLCDRHSARLTAPRGWEVVRLSGDAELAAAGPDPDELSALADAVREPVVTPTSAAHGLAETDPDGPGRRGHLRVLPAPEM